MPSSGREAKRVARPMISSTGNVSSLDAASRAAQSGSRSGTLYSSSKSFTANSQELILSRPELKNTDPTAMRIVNWMSESGMHSSQSRAATNHRRSVARAVVSPTSMAVMRALTIEYGDHPRLRDERYQRPAWIEIRLSFERLLSGHSDRLSLGECFAEREARRVDAFDPEFAAGTANFEMHIGRFEFMARRRCVAQIKFDQIVDGPGRRAVAQTGL